MTGGQCSAQHRRLGGDLHYCILGAGHEGSHCCFYEHEWATASADEAVES